MGCLNLFLFFWATLQKDPPYFPGSAVPNPCVTQLGSHHRPQQEDKEQALAEEEVGGSFVPSSWADNSMKQGL